jgi:hypothetical protein
VCPIYPSRFPNHIHFPDYKPDELLEIAKRMVAKMLFRFGDGVIAALRDSRSRCLCPLCPSDKELWDWVMTLM